MARFHGAVGYGESVEAPPGSGVWIDAIVEKNYYGDILQNTRKLESGIGLNSDISVSNQVSILCDQYAIEHFFQIKYVVWEGVYWSVTDVQVRRPRLTLSLGEVYNGPKA